MGDARSILGEVEERLHRGIDSVQAYLATPEGRMLRRRVARAMIVAAPFVFRSKVVSRSPVGQVLALLGGAALVAKLAEAIRDWEPAATFEAGPKTND